MKYFVYYAHCYEIIGIEEFDTAEEATKFAMEIVACSCDVPHVRIFKGIELALDPVEVVTKYRLIDKVQEK